MSDEFPHYHLVPKDEMANLAFRKELLKEAAESIAFARKLREMCAEDILFYINAFCWTYDPRDDKIPHKPFITYGFQDTAVRELLDAIRKGRDVVVPKSRAMGASWVGLSVFEWFWHFHDGLTFLLISRNQDYVDKLGDPKALFYKIDYLHEKMPKWLLPTDRHLGRKDPNRKMLHLENADNGSVIAGESTTGDAGRGGRFTAIFIDEFAAFKVDEGFAALSATQAATNCRIFNSTPQGQANAFAHVCFKTAARQVRMHWTEHPVYRQGLYEVKNGVVKVLDDYRGEVSVLRKGQSEEREYLYPDNYPFEVSTDRMRSIWYDLQCARCATDQEISQELDIDFAGSDYQFFDPQFINALIDQHCFDPMFVGDFEFDAVDLSANRLYQNKKGDFHLWMSVPGAGPLFPDFSFLNGMKFAVGADVSMGTGASNSVASVANVDTGEKVAVYRTPNVEPKKFARICMALAKCFNDARLIWDATGSTGRAFTKEVIEFGYPNIYYRESEGHVRKRISDQPGMYLQPDDRSLVFQDYREALSNFQFINRSKPGMEETLQFIMKPGAGVEHAAAAYSQDPSGARSAHGDEAMADALVSRLVNQATKMKPKEEVEIPTYSVASRLRADREAELVALQNDW